MTSAVMVVFSGTAVNEDLFREALYAATESGSKLILLDVRHLRQAERLGEALSWDSYLGREAIQRLKGSVKALRNHAIRRTLATMERRAREQGIDVETCEVKGPYLDSVRDLAREKSVDLVMIEDRPETRQLRGPFRVVRV